MYLHVYVYIYVCMYIYNMIYVCIKNIMVMMGSHNVQLSHFSTGLFMGLYGDNGESNPIEDSVGYFFKGATM